MGSSAAYQSVPLEYTPSYTGNIYSNLQRLDTPSCNMQYSSVGSFFQLMQLTTFNLMFVSCAKQGILAIPTVFLTTVTHSPYWALPDPSCDGDLILVGGREDRSFHRRCT